MWIEILSVKQETRESVSQPARAVWIEIPQIQMAPYLLPVTACEGCVD